MKKLINFKNKFILILYVILISFQLSSCDQFGSIPKDNDYLRMKKSPNYNIPKDTFFPDCVLRKPEEYPNMFKKV